MLKLRTIVEAQLHVAQARRGGRLVGIVPTMGALHDGHLALVRQSNAECDETIATIFVNPTQFGPGEDLSRYPRTLDEDLSKLQREGASAVFIPTAEEMYPAGFSTFVEPPEVSLPLEGVRRPGHYRGVATVVLKLFHALPAHRAYFGRKDYQQLKVIQAMARDLSVAIEVVMCETVRDPDGLAMSSRNRYLSPQQRSQALLLSQALTTVNALASEGEKAIDRLELAMRRVLLGESIDVANSTVGVDSIEYATVVDAQTLSPLSILDRPAVALIAARVGSTRLIDNELIE